MLQANAIITDPEEVWDYLEATQAERVELADTMQSWINACSDLLERECNRNISSREYVNARQNGNGSCELYLKHYPISVLTSLTVWTPDLQISYAITVDNVEATVDMETGLVVLLPSAPIGWFPRGRNNVVSTYTAGFAGTALDVFADAVKEMILIRWRARGEYPLDLVTSQSIGANLTNTRFDPRRLSHIVQRVADAYRAWSV